MNRVAGWGGVVVEWSGGGGGAGVMARLRSRCMSAGCRWEVERRSGGGGGEERDDSEMMSFLLICSFSNSLIFYPLYLNIQPTED